MRMTDLIQKKKDGERLTAEELEYIISSYSDNKIPDYQISAWLMAIFFNGMSDEEISDLTMAMVRSGDQIDLSGIEGIKVDKHSTGGVGDKVSLIVAPLVASLGVPVGKMSGRGLGHTGGTIDKLESIEGFDVQLSPEAFIDAVNRYKIALVGQTGNLAPADKKLYALRDVTATVDSIPLIASSIMSKKIAAGADAIVLDVKVGSGAFMKELDSAKTLAQTMVNIGRRLNKRTVAIISDMNQPLGREVGNANEVREAIEVLQGKHTGDLVDVSVEIAAYMLVLGGKYDTGEAARAAVLDSLRSGRALDTLRTFIVNQGGNGDVVDRPDLLPAPQWSIPVASAAEGYVTGIDAEAVGLAAMMLGAGRETKEDTVDHAVGITLNKKLGDPVRPGETICTLHTNHTDNERVIALIQSAYTIAAEAPRMGPVIYGVIE